MERGAQKRQTSGWRGVCGAVCRAWDRPGEKGTAGTSTARFAMFSPLLKSGNNTSAMTKRICRTMETKRARRLLRRPRASCTESPSTRQIPRKLCSGLGETAITHLLNFAASFEGFATPASRVAFRKLAPLSQGCEVRASSAAFDTVKRNRFPGRNRKELGAF
jgi:hypothetical protein